MASLDSLDPRLRPWAQYLLQVGRQYNPNFVVTSARRSRRKQVKLYRRYLSGKSKIPAAPPGTSLHELGLAFDIAQKGVDPIGDPWLQWLGSVWESWGGKWGGARDPVHFQPRF